MADLSARDRWAERYAKSRVRDVDFTTLSGVEVEPAYGTDDSEWPGEFPFTRGLYATGYRGRAWTIRQFAGFGNAAADQRALQDDPQPRWRRALGGLRHADADGPRLRRPEEPRRGRALRRRDRHRRRHGRAVRRHPAGRRDHVDDDLRPGRPGVLHDAGHRRAAGRRHRRSSTARCRPTSSRSTSRRRSGSSRPSRTCA